MGDKTILPSEDPQAADGGAPAGWWHTTEDGRKVVCDLCPRNCVLGSGHRGFCFVRQNHEGRMVLTTYGRSTGFCIDPIEKKPLNQFYPGTSVLSFGTAGCNLGCKFCQNWSISKSRQVEIMSETACPDDIARTAAELGCQSVAFTYNDPVIWAEYAIDTAKACRQLGVKTVAVTAGYISAEAREPFFRWMDAANVDLKAFTEEFYWKYASGHLQPVLDTLRWLARESEVWVEITNLVIPRANDDPAEIARMCDWIVENLGPEVPLHFTAFHPDFRLTDRRPTPPATLNAAWEIARQAGLKYVYTGNIQDERHQSTYCPGCGRVVIERCGYDLGTYALQGNACRHCGARIAGRFGSGPGSWGSRRLPVRISASPRRGFSERNPNPSGGESATCDPAAAASLPPQPSSPAAASASSPAASCAPQTPPENPSQGDCVMVHEPTEASQTPGAASVRPNLTSQQEEQVFRAVGQRVAAAVRGQPAQRLDEVLAEVADVPVLGAFVSLKRAGQLRSCCGFLGPSVPLHEALDHAAVRAAKDDPRFPPISTAELPYLDMDVWLLWNMQPVTAKGEDRVRAVTIGKHGLQIARGANRGLLLPGVAVEHQLDAEGFLRQVCLKAGLPPDAWKQDDTTLMTFEGYAIHGKLGSTLAASQELPSSAGPTLADLTQLAQFCHSNVIAHLWGATPNFYLPGGYDGAVHGAVLTVHLPNRAESMDCSVISLQPELPLQSTLYNLSRTAAESLRAVRIDPPTAQGAICGVTVLWDPAMHGTARNPDLAGIDPRRRALVVVDQARWAIAFDPERSLEEVYRAALRRLGLTESARAAVYSMATVSTEARVFASNAPVPQEPGSVRPPAVAGQFYPAKPEDMEQLIDQLMPRQREPGRWAGVLVPHAGWIFSGRLAAEAFSRIHFPSRAIIICPKHRPGGAEWAIAPCSRWELPGREVPSDLQLAHQLAEAVPELQLDAEAHRHEHAIEVQLPFLARLAPNTRVVGIAIHGGDYERLARAASHLASALRDMDQRPLLVISSDMNHYADDDRTRQLDRLALDALASLDPKRLYQTVVDHRISMCGVLPAVLVLETLRQLGSLNRCEPVGYATSAEVSGDRRRVVGYAAALFA